MRDHGRVVADIGDETRQRGLGGGTKPDRTEMPRRVYRMIDRCREDYLATRRVAELKTWPEWWPQQPPPSRSTKPRPERMTQTWRPVLAAVSNP